MARKFIGPMARFSNVIRQVYEQTLARVRVRTDKNSSIIISLQWRKGT